MNKFLCEKCNLNYYSVNKDRTCPECGEQMRNLTEEEYELNKVNRDAGVNIIIKEKKFKKVIKWFK